LARLVAEGRRREFAAFGWSPESIPNPEERETFETSKLKWDELNQGQHAAMLQWYRSLIALRRSTPSLNEGTPGNVRVSFDEDQRWLRMERGTITLICNLGASERVFTVKDCKLELASLSKIHVENGAIRMWPDSVVVLAESNG
jgi:maltooligosyltrehalose trehalohydrolase